MARDLGVGVGSYRHFCDTFHIYRDERDLAEQVGAGAVMPLRVEQAEGDLAETTTSMVWWESHLRCAAEADDAASLENLAQSVEQLPIGLVGQAARVFLLKAARVCSLPELETAVIAQLAAVVPLTDPRPDGAHE